MTGRVGKTLPIPNEKEKEGGKGEQRKTKRKICKEGKQRKCKVCRKRLDGSWNKPSLKKRNVCENIQYIFFGMYKVFGLLYTYLSRELARCHVWL